MSTRKTRVIEVRKYAIGEEPSIVEEYLDYTPKQRLDAFLEMRERYIRGRYETDPGFERVLRFAPIA